MARVQQISNHQQKANSERDDRRDREKPESSASGFPKNSFTEPGDHVFDNLRLGFAGFNLLPNQRTELFCDTICDEPLFGGRMGCPHVVWSAAVVPGCCRVRVRNYLAARISPADTPERTIFLSRERMLVALPWLAKFTITSSPIFSEFLVQPALISALGLPNSNSQLVISPESRFTSR